MKGQHANESYKTRGLFTPQPSTTQRYHCLHFLIKIQQLREMVTLQSVNDAVASARIPQNDWWGSGSILCSPHFLLHIRQWHKYAKPNRLWKSRIQTSPKSIRTSNYIFHEIIYEVLNKSHASFHLKAWMQIVQCIWMLVFKKYPCLYFSV